MPTGKMKGVGIRYKVKSKKLDLIKRRWMKRWN
jgi:hypothetical protein